MKSLIYDAQIKETKVVDVANSDMPESEPIAPVPTLEERISSLEDAMTMLMGV